MWLTHTSYYILMFYTHRWLISLVYFYWGRKTGVYPDGKTLEARERTNWQTQLTWSARSRNWTRHHGGENRVLSPLDHPCFPLMSRPGNILSYFVPNSLRFGTKRSVFFVPGTNLLHAKFGTRNQELINGEGMSAICNVSAIFCRVVLSLSVLCIQWNKSKLSVWCLRSSLSPHSQACQEAFMQLVLVLFHFLR